ncbi:MAG: hypothetical protein ACO2O5_12245 [Candidatus Caldipriscus sp.]
MRWEDGERFKSVLARLEGWNVPMVPVGKENRVRGYLVLKVDEVREFLRYSVADLIYDAFISKERLRGLEDLGWDVEVLKPTPELLALWKVGLDIKVSSKVSEAKEKFRALLEYLRGGRDEKVQ